MPNYDTTWHVWLASLDASRVVLMLSVVPSNCLSMRGIAASFIVANILSIRLILLILYLHDSPHSRSGT